MYLDVLVVYMRSRVICVQHAYTYLGNIIYIIILVYGVMPITTADSY